MAGSPKVYSNNGSHGAGALPEIYGLQNSWRDDLPASRKTNDTIKKGNALYEIDLMRWMPPGCPSCRKSNTKAYL